MAFRILLMFLLQPLAHELGLYFIRDIYRVKVRTDQAGSDKILACWVQVGKLFVKCGLIDATVSYT
jgi:hypothetical protein